ncbi:hypothetical protein KUCAC02_017697, partial [Chaenocephalus aceratus]
MVVNNTPKTRAATPLDYRMDSLEHPMLQFVFIPDGHKSPAPVIIIHQDEMCIAVKASVNTAGYTMLSGGRSLCCILSSDTVACYKADAVRYTLDVSGGSHRLWHGKPEEIRAKKTAPPGLLCASSQGCGEVLNELLSSSGAA